MTGRRDGARELLRSSARFPPAGTRVDCAFSGGADSTALLVLAAAAGCHVTAVHVDHGLRPDSAAEADAGAGAGRRSSAPSSGSSPSTSRPARTSRPGRGTARRAVLPAGALTGHTADDRAETMLINLLRGSGLDGLAAMATGPDAPAARPPPRTRRGGCAPTWGLTPVVDPSNTDPRFVRNRVRGELLPLMAEIADRDVVPLAAPHRRHGRRRPRVARRRRRRPSTRPTPGALAAAPGSPGPPGRPSLAAAARATRPTLATVERVLAVARGDHVACEIAGRPPGRAPPPAAERRRGRPTIASADGMGSTRTS